MEWITGVTLVTRPGKSLDDATIHSLIGHDSAAWMKFYGTMYDFVDELRAGWEARSGAI